MESLQKSPLKRTKKKSWLLLLPVLLGIIAGWYLAVRIVSPWHVIKQIKLEEVQEAVFPVERPIDTLRVGCYNVAHGRGGQTGAANWDGGNYSQKQDRLKQIAGLLKDANLNIVVLNEADFSSFWSGHTDQAQIIAKEAGYRYIVEQRNIDAAIPFMRLQFGNAILSKYPITDAVFLDYPHPSRLQEMLVGGFKDGVIATVTLPDGKSLQIAAVHLSLEGEAYRQASVQMILHEKMNTGLPMIVMGDFNSTAKGWPGYQTGDVGENAIDTLLVNEDWNTFSIDSTVQADKFTFPSQDPTKTIDWIFVSSPWTLHEHAVITSELSDHLPVIATLKQDDTVVQSDKSK